MALMEQFLLVQQGVVIARCRVQYGKYFAIIRAKHEEQVTYLQRDHTLLNYH